MTERYFFVTAFTLNIGTPQLLTIPVLHFEFNYVLMGLKIFWVSGKQCRTWSDTAFCGVCTEPTRFAQANLSHYLELLWYFCTKKLGSPQVHGIQRCINVVIMHWCWCNLTLSKRCIPTRSVCLFVCWGFTAQSTQWGHVEHGQFT